MSTLQTDLVPTSVFGQTAFCEVGEPSVVATGPTGLLAVGGSLGWPQWNGFAIGAKPVNGSGPLCGWNRCAVYDADTRCLLLIPSRWPVHCAAFSPDGSVLAVGTGSYDGGYCFEGELLIIDPLGGKCRSALGPCREVLEVEWLDDRRLRIVISPAYEEGEPQEPSEYTLGPADWLAVSERSMSLTTEPRYLTGFVRPDPREAASQLDRVAADAGEQRGVRRQVWAVEATDFGVLAALEGVELEAWEASGALRYRRETAGHGRQLELFDARSVITNAEPVWGGSATGFERSPSVVKVIDIDTGRELAALASDEPVVVSSAGGQTLLRASDSFRKAPGISWVVEGLDGAKRTRVALRGYDLFNHYFAIRRAPRVVALQGDQDRPWLHKWAVRLVPRGRWRKATVVEPLFALEWDVERDAQIMGGPGVFVDDARGSAIIHSGWIHDGAGLLPGNAFVVRRRFPDGEVTWDYRADCQASGIDESDGTVFVTFADGQLVRLDAATGEVLGSQFLRIDGHLVVPLSISCGIGSVYVGTMDGRILTLQ